MRPDRAGIPPDAATSPAHPGSQADRPRSADAAVVPPACAYRLRWSVAVRCSCWLSLYYGCGDGGGGAGCGAATGGGVRADGGTCETGLFTTPARASSKEMPRRLSVWPVWLYNSTRLFS